MNIIQDLSAVITLGDRRYLLSACPLPSGGYIVVNIFAAGGPVGHFVDAVTFRAVMLHARADKIAASVVIEAIDRALKIEARKRELIAAK